MFSKRKKMKKISKTDIGKSPVADDEKLNEGFYAAFRSIMDEGLRFILHTVRGYRDTISIHSVLVINLLV